MFAIESMCLELLDINSYSAIQLKAIGAVIIGFGIGVIHFYTIIDDHHHNNKKAEGLISILRANSFTNRVNKVSDNLEITALMQGIAGRIEHEESSYMTL